MSDLEDTFSRSLQSFLSHPGHKTSNCNFLEPLPLWKTSLESPPFPSFPTASPSPLSHPDEALLHPPGCCSTARSRRCWAHIHQGSPWPAADVRREDEKREWTVQWFPGGAVQRGKRHYTARSRPGSFAAFTRGGKTRVFRCISHLHPHRQTRGWSLSPLAITLHLNG